MHVLGVGGGRAGEWVRLARTGSPGKSVGQVDDVAWREQVHEAFQGGAPGRLAEGRGEQDLLAVGGDVLHRPGGAVVGEQARVRPAPPAGRGYTELDPDMREAGMTLVVNVVLYAAIVLVPLGMAVLFIRLGRIFSSR